MRKVYFLRGLFILVLFFNSVLIFAQNKITSFPYSESFESGLGEWIQSASDNMD